MLRITIFLAVSLAIFVVFERSVGTRTRRARVAAEEVAPLLEPARKTGVTVAAIQISRPGGGEALLYVRAKGAWRCAQAYGAIADPREIEAAVSSFTQARGVVRTDDPALAAQFGFGGEDEIVVSFHGSKVLDAPDRDVLFSFDVGRGFDSGSVGAAFVRETGTHRIVEIDRDPRPRLFARRRPELPPMIDPRLMAGSTPATFKGFREFFVDFESGESLHLSAGPPASAGEPAPWTLEHGESARACPPWRIAGFSTMWFRAEGIDIGDPRRAADVGLDPPFARVTLGLVDGGGIEFALSRVNAKNELYVWNKATNVVYVVEGEMQSVLAPGASMFLDESRPNPWERWLSK